MKTPSPGMTAWRKCLLAVTLSFVFAGLANAQTQVVDTTAWGTAFLVYTPPGYNPAVPAPLLVYLHGGGSIGHDFTILTKSSAGDKGPPWLIANKKWPSTRPFIVVSPQLHRNKLIKNKNDQEWNMDTVNELVTYVKSQFNIDQNKLYFTGMSLGGAGCWTFAETYPSQVAAFVPLSGKTDLTKACLVKDIPVWVFHGASDRLVFPTHSINMVNAINACSPAPAKKPKLNLLNAKEHEGWNEVWDGTDGYLVFDWLLKFVKNNATNVAPMVTAVADLRVLNPVSSLHLVSEAFDTDGTITSAGWTKVSGPSVTLTNAATPNLKLTNLVVGTYIFRYTATDNNGASSFDDVTVDVLASVPTGDVVVTGMTLMNGTTNADIGAMSENMVINTTTLGTQFNIKSTATLTTTKSIRYRINGDQNTRTIGTVPFYIKKQTTTPEWAMAVGEYNVCATPYKKSNAGGTPGVSLCIDFTVVTQPAARIATPDVEEVKGEVDGLHIYPTVTRTTIHVQGDSKAENSVTQFKVVNLMGQEILGGSLTHESLMTGTDITLNNPSSGIHFLILKNDHQQKKLKFIVE